MAYRYSDPHPVHWDDLGTLCPGGSLTFSITATATAKSVYAEPALSTDLGNVITLDASGRAATEIWMNGIYRVVLKDSAGVQVWSKDNVRDVAAGGLSPLNPASGTDGQVYSTDGVTAEWRTIVEVPDMTGHANKVLGNNGTTAAWEAKEAATVYSSTSLPGGITSTSTRVVVGLVAELTGSDTAPTAAARSTSKVVTFATAFSGTPTHISITPGIGSVNSEGACVSAHVTGLSASGCTVGFYAGAEDLGTGSNFIDSAIPFTYKATGPA